MVGAAPQGPHQPHREAAPAPPKGHAPKGRTPCATAHPPQAPHTYGETHR